MEMICKVFWRVVVRSSTFCVRVGPVRMCFGLSRAASMLGFNAGTFDLHNFQDLSKSN